MRLLFSAFAAALCLSMLPSCSATKNMTRADLAAFKLRDLTRFGQPHIVKVSPQEVEKLVQAERMSGQMASLDPRHRVRTPRFLRAPSDYVPPMLPAGSISFDGSILPPKNSGGRAVLDVHGHIPGPGSPPPVYATTQGPAQQFSIE